ncbi:MAG: CoA transferase [Paraburkholderia sp.]|jgi:formyl-CoA transferase|nr:CoA transferase [Paraburkholderia sp.]
MLEGALKGVKVLDLSRILAGPWCTQNMADMGAEVIKIENPDGGDDTREWGPHYLDFPDGEARLSAYFASCNRGKRSVAIDFSKPQGAAIVRHLASKADVVVENFKSGSLAKYGLDYETLRVLNPRLVYLSITGFGQKGPMAGRPGYDYVFQGAGGLLSYTGWPDGEPGAGPVRVGASIIDVSTGMYGTVAVLGALLQRAQTGEGQHIDLALSDVAVAINANNNLSYLISGKSPQRLGNAHANLAPYEIFPCADGYLILAVGNDPQFVRFCNVAGRPDMAGDARYVTNEDRLKNRASLCEEVGKMLSTRTQQEWGDAFDANGIPWGPINTLEQVFASPQTQYRQMAQTLTHREGASVPTVRNPVAMVDISTSKAPPLLGEDTREILMGLEMSSADIEQLETQGVVHSH